MHTILFDLSLSHLEFHPSQDRTHDFSSANYDQVPLVDLFVPFTWLQSMRGKPQGSYQESILNAHHKESSTKPKPGWYNTEKSCAHIREQELTYE